MFEQGEGSDNEEPKNERWKDPLGATMLPTCMIRSDLTVLIIKIQKMLFVLGWFHPRLPDGNLFPPKTVPTIVTCGGPSYTKGLEVHFLSHLTDTSGY